MPTAAQKGSRKQSVIGAKRADAKGRIMLGAAAGGKEFDIACNDDGQFILTPMVRIPERDLWLYRNPEALAIFRAGLAEAAAGLATEGEDYSQYADLDIDEE